MAYYFELPTFTDLTNNQRLALEEEDAIALSGGPGTGKTVVSLWRHIRNYELDQRNSLLLTYTKTLEFYLKQTARKQDVKASNNIDRTCRWTHNNRNNGQHYDEIIIDEAQDVELEKYEIIKRLSNMVSYGADEAQSLYCPRCSSIDELRELFSDNEEYELAQNFRNSKEILLFTQSVFPNINIPYNLIESAPLKERMPYIQVIGWDDFQEKVVENIIEITEDFSEETHNIGILVPSVNMVNEYNNLLSNRIRCSRFQNEMGNFESLERIHITTFKSAKGLEFDTVIIPKFDSYNWFINNADNFSENDFYVALTRAKLNLFLLCINDINIGFTDTYENENETNNNITPPLIQEADDDLPF